MMIAKRTVVGIALLVALVAAGAVQAQAPGTKVAVFDPQRVSEETAQGQRIKSDLEAFQAKKQAELDTIQDSVRAMRKQLSEQALSLSAERKAQLEKDIQRKLVELQGAEEAATREFQLELSEAQQRFQLQILQAVDAFGRDEGFDLILDAGTVAYASPAADVTTAIVDRFNTMFPVAAAAGGDGGS